jgi:hypothetical protein
MMHAVIRNGQDALHLIGNVDAYSLEALRDHTRSRGREGSFSIEIDVSPEDAGCLAQKAGRWLERLTRWGASGAVHQRKHCQLDGPGEVHLDKEGGSAGGSRHPSRRDDAHRHHLWESANGSPTSFIIGSTSDRRRTVT